MNILYIGSNKGTSGHRGDALIRNGHNVEMLDPSSSFPQSLGIRRCIDKWIYETGGVFLEHLVCRQVLSRVKGNQYHLIWVNGGELVSRQLISALRQCSPFILNYNNDDPFGGRDKKKWKLYLDTLPLYDLVVVVREPNVKEAYNCGAKRVLRVYMSADEIAHAQRPISFEDRRRWNSDVAFIGTWMPERGPFLSELTKLGIPISIWGDRWHKAKEWSRLRAHWRGGALEEDHYAKAVQCSKICLGLLSKGNRDLSTTRSFEIPYLGGLLCAERTVEHTGLYIEGEEAVFWSNVHECAEKCEKLLCDDGLRESIAAKGRVRAIENALLNQNITKLILESA